jgi:hypothetical protein
MVTPSKVRVACSCRAIDVDKRKDCDFDAHDEVIMV